MFRTHAMWLYTESTELPRSFTPRFSKSGASRANSTNSVVHTGVKSAGCEKRRTHFPLPYSDSFSMPCVVLASKSGAGPFSSIRLAASGTVAGNCDWDAAVALVVLLSRRERHVEPCGARRQVRVFRGEPRITRPPSPRSGGWRVPASAPAHRG